MLVHPKVAKERALALCTNDHCRCTFSFEILQKGAFSLVKSRLDALGSPGCLVVWFLGVTMPKMTQHTGEWLLTVP